MLFVELLTNRSIVLGDYADIYRRAIEENVFGFKLALGGTGIGKTRAIRQIIVSSKTEQTPFKFVYCANRIQLLNEMYRDLTKKDGFSSEEVIHLERNRDTVINTIINQKHDFYQFLWSDEIVEYAKLLRLDLVSINKICKQIEHISNIIKLQDRTIEDIISTGLESLTREVLSFFRAILRRASQEDKNLFFGNSIIKSLFPYIAFKYNPNAKVLLLTIQKAFLGFFDGQSNINITDLKNLIIFLDEFDFLESDLTQLICDSPQIEDPFLFVEMFYKAMKQHKLPLSNYPIESKIPDIRDEISFIVDEIDRFRDEENILFPEINQFTRKFVIGKFPSFARTGRLFKIRFICTKQIVHSS